MGALEILTSTIVPTLFATVIVAVLVVLVRSNERLRRFASTTQAAYTLLILTIAPLLVLVIMNRNNILRLQAIFDEVLLSTVFVGTVALTLGVLYRVFGPAIAAIKATTLEAHSLMHRESVAHTPMPRGHKLKRLNRLPRSLLFRVEALKEVAVGSERAHATTPRHSHLTYCVAEQQQTKRSVVLASRRSRSRSHE